MFRHPDHIPTGYDIKSEFKKAFDNLTHFDLAQATHDAIRAIYGVADDIVLYWAHHEKLLLVDNELAFMGGLDMCTAGHLLHLKHTSANISSRLWQMGYQQ